MNNTYKACSQGSPVTSKVMLPPSCLPAKFLQKTNQPTNHLKILNSSALGQEGMMMMMMVVVAVVVVVLLLPPLTKS